MRYAILLLLAILTGCASTHGRPQQIRILVFNIHAGRDASGGDNLARVAELIRTTGADLVLLQEVDRKTTRSGGVDQLATLMQLTGFHGVLGKSLDYQGGEYGIATLSRWPVTAHEIIHLPVEPPQKRAGGSTEPRVALFIETRTPEGEICVMNTHLDSSGDDIYRRQEVAYLTRVLDPAGPEAQTFLHGKRPILTGGDFNSTPESAVQNTLRQSGLRDAWAECGSGASLTYPAATPIKRIDYLFLKDGMRCRSAQVLDSNASDHRPLLVDVTSR